MSCSLVCLPGFMCDRALFEAFETALSKRTGAAVSPHHGDVYSDPSVAGMAARVLAEAPDRFALLGFSMGGFVAREIALTAPERVSALVLVATSARATSAQEQARKREILDQVRATGFKGMSRRALQRSIHPDHPDRDHLVDQLAAMGTRLGGAVLANQIQAVREDGHVALARIAIPSLVIAGRDDALRPLVEVEALARGLPDARFTVLEGCGHMVPLEQPNALAAQVSGFLEEIGAAQA